MLKLLSCLIFTLALTMPLPAQVPSETEDQLQARRELNEAARLYREGNFTAAQAHAETAMQLDPQNRLAPFYLARIIQAQYKPNDTAPENVEKAREAVTAYQKVLEQAPGDDEAYKAVAYLYSALKEEELFREWVLQRAGNVSFDKDRRAEAFVVLASKDWDCSYKITELPANKVTTLNENKASTRYRMPKVQAEFERAKECANRALEMANMAITLTPENESAWSYKTNILLELGKLAEMSGDVQKKREFYRQYEEALSETKKLAKPSNP